MENDADNTFGADGLLVVVTLIALIAAAILAGCAPTSEYTPTFRTERILQGSESYTSNEWYAKHPGAPR